MKLTDKLFLQAEDLWEEAADKPFVRKMADGTLPAAAFRNYMLQDYLYLQDYMDILRLTLDRAEDPDLAGFIRRTIDETERETYRVHLPNMKALGITDVEIKTCIRCGVIREYVEYMRSWLEKYGLLAGLTALLQCSWAYVYIGRKASDQNRDAILSSPYRSWFDAYTSEDYIRSNDMWIKALNDMSRDQSEEDISSGLSEDGTSRRQSRRDLPEEDINSDLFKDGTSRSQSEYDNSREQFGRDLSEEDINSELFKDETSRSQSEDDNSREQSKEDTIRRQSNNDLTEKDIISGLSEEETDRLCRIFRTCAEYENKFWDALDQ